jgi:GTP cyclohydrolase II
MKTARLFTHLRKRRRKTGRPLVTMSYAQSLDGSIAARRGKPLSLSGRESLKLSHRLRAVHDAIIVGIGTIMSDNPQLNVRFVKGNDPQPVILDSTLRFPDNAKAMRNRKTPWLATTSAASKSKRRHLEKKGLRVIGIKANRRGWIDLKALLSHLATENINNLMVEGGARVITIFLGTRLVDSFVITLTPFFVGGLHAVEQLPYTGKPRSAIGVPSMKILGNEHCGRDLVVWGTPK